MDSAASSAMQPTHYHRQACTECQRRKQKCSREWPCNHCQKRKVAEKCTFSTWTSGVEPPIAGLAKQSQQGGSHIDGKLSPRLSEKDSRLETLGYMTNELLQNLGLESKTDHGEYFGDADTCPQLEHALRVLPAHEQLDHIVDTFFTTVNLHYLIVHEATFRSDYQAWWQVRPQRQGISLQWTCLLLMVCACTIQQLDEKSTERIEHSLGETTDQLSEKYHNAARELGSAIPLGRYHIHNVLWQLHSCYWFKAEAKFLEAWHVLGTAVREAQELGLHRVSASKSMNPVHQEIRRRVWCVLDTWDWQMSSGLGRPTIIDRSDVDVALPNLALEPQPSPLLHMKLQSKLIRQIASRFGAPKYVVEPNDVQEYQRMIEKWMSEFPDYFKLTPAVKSLGAVPHWLVYHRYYLWTMAYLMILNPIRPYMAKTYDSSSPQVELDIYAAGLRYARDLTIALDGWVNITSHRDGWFHFQIFSIFDVASMLTVAVKMDENEMIPDRCFVFDAIDCGLAMLRTLNRVSETVTVWEDLLFRQIKQLPRPIEATDEAQRKRVRIGEVSNQPGGPGDLAKNIKTEPTDSRTWPPATERVPAESENPGLDAHTSTSISPLSSDNQVELPPQVSHINDLQPQIEAFTQDIDWSFFQDIGTGFERDWMNWPSSFELESYPTAPRRGYHV